MPLDSSYVERHALVKTQPDLTSLLRRARRGDPVATEQIGPIVYAMLRSLARRHRRGQGRSDTLETTELIHEAYLRLFGSTEPTDWASRDHFVSASAQAIRCILVDHVRRRRSLKRSLTGWRIPLDDLVDRYERRSGDLEALDEALARLADFDQQSAQIIELSFFAGLRSAEIASVVHISVRTVERKLQMARAWLRGELTRG